jgi:LysR family hydrogen peroxide-inducible transcriptional activator
MMPYGVAMTPLPTPQQLRYLLCLAEKRHFGRAAAACAVSQSTLSAGILALERQLDAHLLDRDAGKRVVFTALGTELVARARTAMAALEAVTEAASASRAPMAGPLRLGVIPTIGPFLLPRLMPAVRTAFPQLRLFLREDETERLLEGMQAGRLDVLLLALPYDCGNVEVLPVLRDEFVVALPPNHPLASHARIPVQALGEEGLLLLEEGHCLREQALEACGLANRNNDGFAATSLHTLVQMVAGGLGVTLVPQIALDAGIAAGTDIVLRPLDGAGAWRTLGFVWRRQASRSADYRALAAILAQAASTVADAPSL